MTLVVDFSAYETARGQGGDPQRSGGSPKSHIHCHITREPGPMQEPASVINRESTETGTTDTLDKVRALLQERYGIDEHQVEMDTELTALGLDSLSLVEYAFDL